MGLVVLEVPVEMEDEVLVYCKALWMLLLVKVLLIVVELVEQEEPEEMVDPLLQLRLLVLQVLQVPKGLLQRLQDCPLPMELSQLPLVG